MSVKKDLEERLRHIILHTCNKVGCRDCDFKWEGGCSAAELQGQILDIEMEELKHAPRHCQDDT